MMRFRFFNAYVSNSAAGRQWEHCYADYEEWLKQNEGKIVVRKVTYHGDSKDVFVVYEPVAEVPTE